MLVAIEKGIAFSFLLAIVKHTVRKGLRAVMAAKILTEDFLIFYHLAKCLAQIRFNFYPALLSELLSQNTFLIRKELLLF